MQTARSSPPHPGWWPGPELEPPVQVNGNHAANMSCSVLKIDCLILHLIVTCPSLIHISLMAFKFSFKRMLLVFTWIAKKALQSTLGFSELSGQCP